VRHLPHPSPAPPYSTPAPAPYGRGGEEPTEFDKTQCIPYNGQAEAERLRPEGRTAQEAGG